MGGGYDNIPDQQKETFYQRNKVPMNMKPAEKTLWTNKPQVSWIYNVNDQACGSLNKHALNQ